MAVRFEVEKNLLDIEERTNRTYHISLVVIALTIISIIIALINLWPAEPWQPLLYLLFGVPLWLFYEAFECRARANAAIDKMKMLA